MVTRGAPIARAMDIANNPSTLKGLTVWFMKGVSSTGSVTPDVWSAPSVSLLDLNSSKRYRTIWNHHVKRRRVSFSLSL